MKSESGFTVGTAVGVVTEEDDFDPEVVLLEIVGVDTGVGVGVGVAVAIITGAVADLFEGNLAFFGGVDSDSVLGIVVGTGEVVGVYDDSAGSLLSAVSSSLTSDELENTPQLVNNIAIMQTANVNEIARNNLDVSDFLLMRVLSFLFLKL